MRLSELEAYVARLRQEAAFYGHSDPEVEFSVHRNQCSALLRTSKHHLALTPASLDSYNRRYLAASDPNKTTGAKPFRGFVLDLEPCAE